MALVQFAPRLFRRVYPRFKRTVVTDAQLEHAFKIACLLWDNTEKSRVPVEERALHLDLLVCHLATLALWGASGQSGPVSSQTAGTSSLSLSFQLPQRAGREFFLQTPCGNSFWAATLKYRAGGKYYAPNVAHPWG